MNSRSTSASSTNPNSNSAPPSGGGPRPIVWLVALGALVLLIVLVMPRPGGRGAAPSDGSPAEASGGNSDGGGISAAGGSARPRPRLASEGGRGAPRTAEQQVADKVTAFARQRRDLAGQVARQLNLNVPPDVQKFFDAVEAGDWREIKGLYSTLMSRRDAGADPELAALWPALRETYGAVEQSQFWPAQELLSYGQTVLSALPPGAVVIAGNDASRAIPALVSETGGGAARPVILPADSTDDAGTLAYLSLVHGDRLVLPSSAEAQSGDAEPNAAAGGRSRAGGLFRALIEKNPNTPLLVADGAAAAALGLEVVPRGPVLEVVSGGATVADTQARATETLAYWRDTAQRLQADGSMAGDAPTRQAYANMAVSQANLYATRNLPSEADELYRYAVQVAPAAIAPVQSYASYLAGSGRIPEAIQMLDAFAQQNEGMRGAAEAIRRTLTPQQ